MGIRGNLVFRGSLQINESEHFIEVRYIFLRGSKWKLHFFQVFCYVAQRMTAEGSEKTWDQCRIKLKNLKSQYRYVKDRIPNIDEVDLEDDDVLKQLIAECQGRGISPSNIKHLRLVKYKRF